MIRPCLAPWARAAITNSRELQDNVAARVIRPSMGIDTIPSAKMMFQVLRPKNVTIDSASTSAGNAKNGIKQQTNNRVGPALEISSDQADRASDENTECNRADSDKHRRPGSVNNSTHQVAAVAVATEPVVSARRLPGYRRRSTDRALTDRDVNRFERIIDRQKWRSQSADQNDREPDHSHPSGESQSLLRA